MLKDTIRMANANNELDGEEILRDALAKGYPVVAFLGQSAGIGREGDPVLKAALKKADAAGTSWRSLVNADELDAGFYPWLAEGFLRTPATAELAAIGDAPFSAIYTSSIDPRLSSLFETNGREPEIVLFGDPPPSIKRSRRRPPLYQLFGRAGGGGGEFQPPSSTQALARRRMLHASPMARTLIETATALGLVVIEGYRPGDWFRADDLLALLAEAAPRSVVWFGELPSFSDEDQPSFDMLVSEGIVVTESRPLGRVLAQIAAGEPQLLDQRWDDPGIISFASGKKLVTSPQLRLATEASATIVDDGFTAFLPPLSAADSAADFRSFHAISNSARAVVQGVRRGYAFERDFEVKLASLVDRAVSRHHEQRGALVLHGQSGTGKSIAMARLALHLREKKSAAVLLALNSLPQAMEVAEFLAAVDGESEVTAILVDASESIGRYDDFLDALRSRGHRVVVVGTSYRQENPPEAIRNRLIEAPSLLSLAEKEALGALSKRAGLVDAPSPEKASGDYALPGFFYRLPASRLRISEGLGREARHVSSTLKATGSTTRKANPLGSLGSALVDAGFPAPTSSLLEDEGADIGDWGSETAVNRLIDYVMVSARLYQWVPVNLVLRAVTRDATQSQRPLDLDAIRALFESHDLFRWRLDDEEGNELLVGARLQLEAELICNRRLGGATGEARRLSELIRAAVRAGTEWNSETKYLVDVVHAVGPDGPFKERYSESYSEVARTLSVLRTGAGVENARLMLQEATLRRHYVRLHQPDPTLKAALLDEARSTVDEALNRSEGRNSRVYASRRTIDNLWVERAATYGFMATDAAERGGNQQEIWPSYLAARNAVRKALGRVDSYFPVDIGLWLPARILKAATVSPGHAVELEADIRATLDLVDPLALDPKQYEIFQRQRLSCGEVLRDEGVSDDAFEMLRQAGSTAGYYLRARLLAPTLPEAGSDASIEDLKKAEQARSYLREVYPFVAGDARCLQLLLSCEWLTATGKWLFRDQRQPLPWDQSERLRIRQVLAELASISSSELQAKYRYLDAVFCWLVDDERTAIDKFRALSSDTEFIESGRVVTRHEITDESGRPTSYSGTVMRRIGENRWSVHVDSMQRNVDLVATDFRQIEIAKGTIVRNFTVGFNFLGPLARPVGKP
jgi:hypothetical protein